MLQHLWIILSITFTIVVFTIFYKITHKSSDPNAQPIKWGWWKSTKIIACLFIIFSALFYSLLHISWIRNLIFPSSAAVIGGASELLHTIQVPAATVINQSPQQIPTSSNMMDMRDMRGGGSGNNENEDERHNRHEERRNRGGGGGEYRKRDRILTEPPNF
jgi:hypothetical protein